MSTVATIHLRLAGLFALLVLSPANAEDITATVSAGKRTPIGSIGTYNTFTCTQAAVPQCRKPVSHDSLSMESSTSPRRAV